MTKPIDEILAPKPEARPRNYAYSIEDAAHKGLAKAGEIALGNGCIHPKEGSDE